MKLSVKMGNHKIHISIIIFLLCLMSQFSYGQEKEKNWSLNGYIKNMQTVIINDVKIPALGIDTTLFLQDNLIHNRLNFKWYPNQNFTFKAEMRNRVFWGDLVKSNPDYGKLIENGANDFFNLSSILVDNNNVILHSTIDRLYMEYMKGDWEIRIGRQRINWGINTVWNPNDVFNAFSFTDFDYEERPGSDAVRIKYYTGFASSIEIAAKAFENIEDAVFAGLWKFNKWNYDFQILSGYAQEELVLGGGWAGNLKNAGFKGEFSYFQPFEEDIEPSFAGTLAFDYSFKKGLYYSGGYLYNSNGDIDTPISNLFSFELSAKNLYPYRHALFSAVSYPFNPLLSGTLSVIYSPGEAHAMFINPLFTYSIANNWNLDFVGQIVFNNDDGYISPIQALFLRIKYSF